VQKTNKSNQKHQTTKEKIMKRYNKLLLAAAAILAAMVLMGQSVHAQTCESTGAGKGNRGIPFVDANGDGFNDNALDHDGDGIPNGQDPDYVRSGFGRGHGFVDADGDGINDFAQDADGDGIPNGQDPDYVRPQDGSGRRMGNGLRQAGSAMGSKLLRGFRGGSNTGTGICTGTGPVGLSKGRGK